MVKRNWEGIVKPQDFRQRALLLKALVFLKVADPVEEMEIENCLVPADKI
jgi:hypothetical protein